MKSCKKHGTSYLFEHKDKSLKSGSRIRCRACLREAGKARRRKIKAILVEEHGSKCISCGYDKCIAALHFHHKDKNEKVHHVSSRSLKSARKEAEKCILLCANCHAELEYEEETA